MRITQLMAVALVFGNVGCATPDDDSGLATIVEVSLNGESTSWSVTGANTWQVSGLVLVTGSSDDGREELRLRMPNEAGTYACRGAPRVAGTPSVDLQYVYPTETGGKSAVIPLWLDDPQWDCAITLSAVGDDHGARWEGRFSGELYVDDSTLPMDQRQISARDGRFKVERAAP